MKHWQLAPPSCGMPDPGVPGRPKSVAQLLWMSRTPEGTQPRGSGEIHPLETHLSSVGSSGVCDIHNSCATDFGRTPGSGMPHGGARGVLIVSVSFSDSMDT